MGRRPKWSSHAQPWHDPKITSDQGVVGENIFADTVSKFELGIKCAGDECKYTINKALQKRNSKSETINKYLYRVFFILLGTLPGIFHIENVEKYQ